jgi:hypothetical protein
MTMKSIIQSQALTSMLEPIMIVFLALIVGTIVLALFTPAYQHHHRLAAANVMRLRREWTKSE